MLTLTQVARCAQIDILQVPAELLPALSVKVAQAQAERAPVLRECERICDQMEAMGFGLLDQDMLLWPFWARERVTLLEGALRNLNREQDSLFANLPKNY